MKKDVVLFHREFAPLCVSAGYTSLRHTLARHQPSGLPRPVPLGRGPRKVFFATYTPPRKTDWIFLRRCGGANSVRLERGAPGFAGHSSFARLYKASRFRAAARNVFYGKAKRTVQTKMNCTPFVRQYDILSNKWGVLLLSNFWGSLQFSAVFFIYSPLRRPATEEIGSEKQMAPAGVPGPAFSLMAFMMAAFSSLRATM